MAKRSAESDIIERYTEIYRNMTRRELEHEFNALSDQILAFLLVIDSESVEVIYDGTHSLTFEFKETKLNYKEQMN